MMTKYQNTYHVALLKYTSSLAKQLLSLSSLTSEV